VSKAIEVITSVERRRRWSAAEKERLVAASLEPSASVSAVAREAGIHPSQLYGWRRQLLRSRPGASFAAVRIAAEPAPTGLPAPGLIELEFANGSRMRITGAVDPTTLTAVVVALASGGRRR
jgi:transposase